MARNLNELEVLPPLSYNHAHCLVDLFEQALSKAPAKDAKKLYLLYAKFEEDHGRARRAMAIYDRACEAVDDDSKFEVHRLLSSTRLC